MSDHPFRLREHDGLSKSILCLALLQFVYNLYLLHAEFNMFGLDCEEYNFYISDKITRYWLHTAMCCIISYGWSAAFDLTEAQFPLTKLFRRGVPFASLFLIAYSLVVDRRMHLGSMMFISPGAVWLTLAFPFYISLSTVAYALSVIKNSSVESRNR